MARWIVQLTIVMVLVACSFSATTKKPTSTSKTSTLSTQKTTITSAPPTTTKSLPPKEACPKRNASCTECVKDARCLWCESRAQKCVAYPVGQLIPHADYCPLGDARWGTCMINYKALLIAMGVIAGLILLTITCCCVYCCCCRSTSARQRRKYEREDARMEGERQERHARNEERRAERAAKNDEIRRKYGLMKDDNPYKRFDEN